MAIEDAPADIGGANIVGIEHVAALSVEFRRIGFRHVVADINLRKAFIVRIVLGRAVGELVGGTRPSSGAGVLTSQ